MSMNLLERSKHQMRVDSFMLRAKQNVPVIPTKLSQDERLLRARLIYEEAIETIAGLGVRVFLPGDGATLFEINGEFNMLEVVDGCCDLKVVTTGTLSACGVPDEAVQAEVDYNNLKKFGPGHSYDKGKLIKPPGHVPPDLAAILLQLGWK